MKGRVGICVLLAALCFAPAQARKIDVGGYRLRVVRKGSGQPTVIFDSGLGDSHQVWREVWPDVARMSRVFLYDRAGLGRSDPAPGPRTSDRMVEELHLLLQRVRATPPYVLVGHSLGGLNIRLFASRYPSEVAGLVLVDATPVGFPAWFEDSTASRAKLETMLSVAPEGMRRELDSLDESAEQVRSASAPARIPVIVISSARREETESFRGTWQRMQKEMAERLEAERHAVSETADHYIQFGDPEIVIEAVLEIIEVSRSSPAARD